MRPIRGFTLLELLVVVTIIVVMLALLAPAMDSAMRSAESVFCASNEHEMGMALMAWLQDHRQTFPRIHDYGKLAGNRGEAVQYGSQDWGVTDRPLNAYMGYQLENSRVRVAECPSDRGDATSLEVEGFTPTPHAYTGYGSSYIEAFAKDGSNWGVKPVFGWTGDQSLPSLRWTNLPRADNKIILGDWPFYGENSVGSDMTRWHDPSERRMNILFGDMRVELFLFPNGAMEIPANEYRPANDSFYWW